MRSTPFYTYEMTCDRRTVYRAVCATLCLAAVFGFAAATLAVGATNADVTIALQTQGPRTSGPVSVSLQNEINAAVDRGREWLLAQQNADGGWGSNSCVRLTALAGLALARDASPDEKAAVRKAGNWLLSPAATNNLAAADLEAQTWRELALQVAAPADPQRTANFRQQILHVYAATGKALSPFALLLIHEATPCEFKYHFLPRDTNASPATRILDDCIREMPPTTLSAPSPAMHALTQLAACWSGQDIPRCSTLGTARQYWVLAHFINRAGGGTLADEHGRVVDWRNDLARKLVETQKVDSQKQGNGFWRSDDAPMDWASHPVAETAFALLALDEL